MNGEGWESHWAGGVGVPFGPLLPTTKKAEKFVVFLAWPDHSKLFWCYLLAHLLLQRNLANPVAIVHVEQEQVLISKILPTWRAGELPCFQTLQMCVHKCLCFCCCLGSLLFCCNHLLLLCCSHLLWLPLAHACKVRGSSLKFGTGGGHKDLGLKPKQLVKNARETNNESLNIVLPAPLGHILLAT